MLDVKTIFAVLCASLLALQPLINFKFFYIYICCFFNQKDLLLAVNDAMASSPQEGAAIDSEMRILRGRPDIETKRLLCTVPNIFNFHR